MNFFTQLKCGMVKPEDVLDFEDKWHEQKNAMPLHDFLGITHQQYLEWMREGDSYFDRFYGIENTRKTASSKKP